MSLIIERDKDMHQAMQRTREEINLPENQYLRAVLDLMRKDIYNAGFTSDAEIVHELDYYMGVYDDDPSCPPEDSRLQYARTADELDIILYRSLKEIRSGYGEIDMQTHFLTYMIEKGPRKSGSLLKNAACIPSPVITLQ